MSFSPAAETQIAPAKRAGIVGLIGRLDYVAAVGCVVLVLGYAALGAYNRRLNPSNPQGFVFALLVESGRLSSALGLDGLVGDLSREPSIGAFVSARFLDVYLPATAMVHLLLAGLVFALKWGLIHGRRWARIGQAALAIAGAVVAALALPIAGATVAAFAAGAVALAVVPPGSGRDAEGRSALAWLWVLALGIAVLAVAGVVTELGLIRAGIAVHRLFGRA